MSGVEWSAVEWSGVEWSGVERHGARKNIADQRRAEHARMHARTRSLIHACTPSEVISSFPRPQEVRGSLKLQNGGLRAPGESWRRYYEKGGPGG